MSEPTPLEEVSPEPTPADAEGVHHQEPASSPPAEKKPVNEHKRAKDRVAAKLRRKLQAVKKAASAEELAELEAGMADSPRKTGEAAATATGPGQPAEKLEEGQLPGWPKPSVIAAHEESARALWSQAAEKLRGTRYGTCLVPTTREYTAEDLKVHQVVVDPVLALAKGTAPLMAQVLGKVSAVSPAATACVSIAMVFGPAVVSHGAELVKELLFSDKGAQLERKQ